MEDVDTYKGDSTYSKLNSNSNETIGMKNVMKFKSIFVVFTSRSLFSREECL